MSRIVITLSASLFCFFFFPQQTLSQPAHISTFCNPIDNFTQTSPYETNRESLLSTLRESSSLGTYSNVTIGLTPDTVYGMFLCRGDVNATSCSDCVQTATFEIAANCSLNKAAIIYYQKCMVRYSNVIFFTLMETSPRTGLLRNQPAPNPNRFNQTLSDKFDQLIRNVSSSSSSLVPYFVEDQELVTQPEGSYELESMVQCSPDLDPFNCTVCLRFGFLRMSTCCGSPSVFQAFFPKCLLRYETFVLTSPPPLSLPPQASAAQSPPPPPLLFTRPQDVPSPSGSSSLNVIKGNEIFGRVVCTVSALVLAIVNL